MRTKSAERTEENTAKVDETRIAEQIVSVFGEGVARACSAERDTIRYAVREAGLKLRTIILNRTSLRRLLTDPLRDIKIEYLRRDLAANAARRVEFHYPRLSRMTPIRVATRKLPFSLAMVSAI